MHPLNDTKIPAKIVFKSPKIQILSSCSAYVQHWGQLLDQLSENTYVIFHDWNPSFMDEQNLYSSEKYFNKFIFCSGNQTAHKRRLLKNLATYHINHNSFCNEKIFKPSLNGKIYDGFMNCRAKDWKRMFLAEKLNNLCLIINRFNISSHRGTDDESYKTLNYSYLNARMVSPAFINDMATRSKFGLCLSDVEGACFSSSEMLLSGLPVISTIPSSEFGTGGREYWYNSYNSRQVAPSKESILEASDDLLCSLPDPWIIHETHRHIMYTLREQFAVDILVPLFNELGETTCPVDLICGEDCYGEFRGRHIILAEGNFRTSAEILEMCDGC